MSTANLKPDAIAPWQGDFVLHRVTELQGKLPKGTLDLSQIGALDTAGAWLILSHARQTGATVTGASTEHALLLKAVESALPPPDPPPRRRRHVEMIDRVSNLGRMTMGGLRGLALIVGFFGQVMVQVLGTLIRPWRLA